MTSEQLTLLLASDHEDLHREKDQKDGAVMVIDTSKSVNCASYCLTFVSFG